MDFMMAQKRHKILTPIHVHKMIMNNIYFLYAKFILFILYILYAKKMILLKKTLSHLELCDALLLAQLMEKMRILHAYIALDCNQDFC